MHKYRSRPLSTLAIIIGNIGTGKTTFCKNLKDEDRKIIRPDELDEEFEFLQREKIIKSALQTHKWVVIDAPIMSRKIRNELSYFARGHQIIAFDFGPGDENSLQRRIQDNPELSASEWREIHEKYQAEYEKPEYGEGFKRIVNKISTFDKVNL